MILVQEAGTGCAMTHSCVGDMTHSCVCDMTHSCVCAMTHSCAWRRPIGSLQLQVISHKRATNCRAFLQKMNYKDKASYGFSPSYRHDKRAL